MDSPTQRFRAVVSAAHRRESEAQLAGLLACLDSDPAPRRLVPVLGLLTLIPIPWLLTWGLGLLDPAVILGLAIHALLMVGLAVRRWYLPGRTDELAQITAVWGLQALALPAGLLLNSLLPLASPGLAVLGALAMIGAVPALVRGGSAPPRAALAGIAVGPWMFIIASMPAPTHGWIS